MRFLLSLCFVLVFSSVSYGQWGSDWTGNNPFGAGNEFNRNSLRNEWGAGNPFKSDGYNNPFSRRGNEFSNESPKNSFATAPPKIRTESGRYSGEWSSNSWRRDSTSNTFGSFGNPFSPDSVRNPVTRSRFYVPR